MATMNDTNDGNGCKRLSGRINHDNYVHITQSDVWLCNMNVITGMRK